MIGQAIGQKYTLVRLLGKGGMGSVYEAVHNDTLDRVAVKVLHNHHLDPASGGARRFRREAEAARAIQSQHVVRGIEAGVDEPTGHFYFVTEYLDGEDLQQILDKVGPIAPRGALLIAAQALLGLCDAHAASVIHRDIKPANMILARREGGTRAVKLLDLGIAKMGPTGGRIDEPADLTTTGSFLGSPLYMSPEQVQSSRDVDPRTDVWSLGCVLYAALAGRAPHQHLSSIGKLLVAICVTPAPPLGEVAPWVPHEVVDVVHRALSLSPEDRFSSARAMLDAIARLTPPGDITEEMLAPIGERPRPVSTAPTKPPASPLSPRVVVVPRERAARGDEATQASALSTGSRDYAREPTPDPYQATALRAPTDLSDSDARAIARSGVPALGDRTVGPYVTVDARRLLGEKTELWTFSLNVHRNLESFVIRIWKSLRRAGAQVPPRTYGTSWILFEPRNGREIIEAGGAGAAHITLEDVGIRSGAVLWVVPPEGDQASQSADAPPSE